MNSTQLTNQLAEVSLYSKNILQQFDINQYSSADFESIFIANGIDPQYFEEIVKMFEGNIEEACTNLKRFPLNTNLEYLQSTHRYYIRKRLLEIEHTITLAFSVEEVNVAIQKYFQNIKNSLLEHIGVEERMLFPYLKSLINGTYGHIANGYSIASYLASHNIEVEKMIIEAKNLIAKVPKNTTIQMPYSLLMKMLETFEIELCVHALVEDMVLIPQGMELEKEFNLV